MYDAGHDTFHVDEVGMVKLTPEQLLPCYIAAHDPGKGAKLNDEWKRGNSVATSFDSARLVRGDPWGVADAISGVGLAFLRLFFFENTDARVVLSYDACRGARS